VPPPVTAPATGCRVNGPAPMAALHAATGTQPPRLRLYGASKCWLASRLPRQLHRTSWLPNGPPHKGKSRQTATSYAWVPTLRWLRRPPLGQYNAKLHGNQLQGPSNSGIASIPRHAKCQAACLLNTISGSNPAAHYAACQPSTDTGSGGTLNTWRSGDDGRTVAERLQVRF
jgi:hypothetical protein